MGRRIGERAGVYVAELGRVALGQTRGIEGGWVELVGVRFRYLGQSSGCVASVVTAYLRWLRPSARTRPASKMSAIIEHRRFCSVS